jgi:phosphoserine aminotransferase
MKRVYNFAAGPATLPETVLKKAADEMLDYKGTGMSVMEMSHRSKTYQAIIDDAEGRLRRLMGISDNHSVLFLQGGASQQFAMIPMNLMTNYKISDYVNTGNWSEKAITEAKLFGKVNIAASSEDKGFTYIPEDYVLSSQSDYVHITTNNTIEGTRYINIPDTGDIPLIADMSSNILSEYTDVEKYGLIYAGAQKNLGPAGVTIVIIRNDLLNRYSEDIPIILRYETHSKKKSLYNTPPCYSIYIMGLVFEWLEDEIGGVSVIEQLNRKKARILYDYIDNSEFYKSPVKNENRSLMNIPFTLADNELNDKFIAEANNEGLTSLKGHRSVGGMRASIYNAMPLQGVEKLVDFMKYFEENNG